MTERDIAALAAGRIDCLKNKSSDPNRPLAPVFPLLSLGWAVVEPVMGYLSDPDPTVRTNAVNILSTSTDPRVFRPLMNALRDSEPAVRFYAARGLGEFGHPDAVEPLIALLKDPEHRIATCAADALGELGDERALRPLEHLLKTSDRVDVRSAAVGAISRIPGSEALDILLAHLENDSSLLRWRSVHGLGIRYDPRIGGVFLRMLGDPKEQVRSGAAHALSQADMQGLVPDLLSLIASSENEHARGNAARMLGQVGDPELAEPLAKLLHDESPRVRIRAAKAIGTLTGATPIDEIADLIDNEDEDVRLAVAKLLAAVNDAHAADVLADLINSDKRQTQKEAVVALAKMGDRRAFGFIDNLCASEDPIARRQATWVLGYLECSEAIDRLIHLLKDEAWMVRRNSLRRLAEIGRADAADHIAPLMEDENELVRHSAMGKLAELGDKRALEPLITELERGAQSLFGTIMAIGKIADRTAIEPLIRATMSAEPDIQAFAARALAKIDHQDAVQALRNALADSDSAWVRRKCAKELVERGGELAEEALAQIVEHEDMDAAAPIYAAIIRCGVPDSEVLLGRTLEHCGHKAMAEDFASCGNQALATAGAAWLAEHPLARYRVMPSGKPSNPMWGGAGEESSG